MREEPMSAETRTASDKQWHDARMELEAWGMSINVVVTGGRDYADEAHVFERLDYVAELYGGVARLAHGACSGADTLAVRWATSRGVPLAAYPAKWREYGRRAGPMRNADMLVREKPAILVAFPGGKGTDDCVRQAQRMGYVLLDCRDSHPPRGRAGGARPEGAHTREGA